MTMKNNGEQKKRKLQIMSVYGTVGAIALAAIAVGIVNRGSKTPRIDLNTTPTPGIQGQAADDLQNDTPKVQKQTAENDNDPQGHPKQQAEAEPFGENQGQTAGSEQVADGSQNQTEPGKELADLGQKVDTAKADTEPKGTAEGEMTGDSGKLPEDSKTELPVVNPENLLSGLNFSVETGMLWPVTGQALISFSPDHVIYNKTLDNYRTTDYVFLEGAVGTHVCAAAEGIVTKISEELWTGKTVTMRVAENYEIVYGMLSNVAVKEGDRVKEGTVIAEIAEPSRYFLEEGSGLYLKVLENGQPVNPMLYLNE